MTIDATLEALAMVMKEHARVIYTVYGSKSHELENAAEDLLKRMKITEKVATSDRDKIRL